MGDSVWSYLAAKKQQEVRSVSQNLDNVCIIMNILGFIYGVILLWTTFDPRHMNRNNLANAVHAVYAYFDFS